MNNRAMILLDLEFQTYKQLLANQPDIMMIDKVQKTTVLIDEAIPADSVEIIDCVLGIEVKGNVVY